MIARGPLDVDTPAVTEPARGVRGLVESGGLRMIGLAGAALMGGICVVVGGFLATPAIWGGLALLFCAVAAAFALLWRERSGMSAVSRALDAAMRAGEDGWYVARSDGSAYFVNRAFERLAGCDTPTALLARASGSRVRDLQAAIDEGRGGTAELSLDDGKRHLRITAAPLGDPPGAVVWRVVDITESHAAAAAASQRMAQLTAMLEHAPAGFYEADAEGRFASVNPALAALLDAAPDALIGQPVGAHLAERPAIAEGGATTAGAIRLQPTGSPPIDAVIAEAPRADNDGRRIGVLLPKPESAGNPSAEGHLEALFERAPIGIARLDSACGIVECNEAFCRALHMQDGTLKGQSIERYIAEAEREPAREALAATLRGEATTMPLEVRIERDRDSERVVSLYATRHDATDGHGLTVHLIDTTERRSLEVQFAQAQKMQAVGQLAGGIAHDFNNLLTAIIGFCDLLLMQHQAGDHAFADIMQIKQNANRAANLVRQLLAFSRQQTLKPKTLVVTDVLAELSNLIRRLIGEKIELTMNHGRDTGFIKADEGQLEQVIVNLAVNARDAMSDGGTLTIRTNRLTTEAPTRIGHGVLPPGDYVRIDVSDTGVGMTKDQLGKIFEPFYTTKEVGAGTGLGLSTVYGIIHQFGGHVLVDSTQGVGTTFSVFLPHFVPDEGTVAGAAAVGAQKAKTRDLTGQGTILLVEDEDAVRMFGARALRKKGYTVLEADCGEMALEVLDAASEPIDLLVTDVVMPGVDGPTLTKQIKETRPDLKVIYISGYAEDNFRSSVDETVNFLPKPFSLSQLASKVKEVMTAA